MLSLFHFFVSVQNKTRQTREHNLFPEELIKGQLTEGFSLSNKPYVLWADEPHSAESMSLLMLLD